MDSKILFSFVVLFTVANGAGFCGGDFCAEYEIQSPNIQVTLKANGAKGWAAFGWNTDLAMIGSDVVVCIVRGTDVEVQNRKISAKSSDGVAKTPGQEATLVSGGYENDVLTCTFTRPLKPADGSIEIIDAEMGTVYAYSVDPVVGDTMLVHADKGSRDVNFFAAEESSPPSSPPPSDDTGFCGGANDAFCVDYVLRETSLEVTIVAKGAKGWAGIGWNSEGKMIGSDIVVCVVKGSNVEVQNRDAQGTYPDSVVKKPNQSATLVEGSFMNDVLTCTFTRPLKPQDGFEIIDADVNTVYALGPIPLTRDFLTYHGNTNRGTRLVNYFTNRGTGEKESSSSESSPSPSPSPSESVGTRSVLISFVGGFAFPVFVAFLLQDFI